MVRGAGWVEMIFLLFGEEVFLGLWVVAFDFRWLCIGVTHPRPLSSGEMGMLFLFGNE